MENFDLYKCEICGNIVQIVNSGGGELVCCGQKMQKIDAKTIEAALEEKHVPIFVKLDNGGEIRVGEILHPMISEHYIMFVQAISADKKEARLKYLMPGDEPKMFLDNYNQYNFAREYCNIHGLWEGKK